MPDAPDHSTLPLPLEEIAATAERAQDGDATVLPALRDLLDKFPPLIEAIGADVTKTVKTTLSRMIAGERNLAFHEALDRVMAKLQADLEGPSPTPLERLLVERSVLCWLHVYQADLALANAEERPASEQKYYLSRQDRAHRQFLSAVKSLATVQKLAVPAIQVNVAEQQVNFGSAPA